MKVKDILKAKGSDIVTIESDSTLKDAMDSIIKNKIGALIVLENNEFVGIISERDLLREFHKNGDTALNKMVNEFMTTKIVIGILEDDISEVEAIMTNNRFRHLPIMHEGKIAGIISIGDVVKSLAANIKAENRYLKDYIRGKYPG